MASFRRAGDERVNVFAVDERYLFKHYFDGDAVFARLQRYYDNQQYRFEVPAEAFEDLREYLADHGYALVVVDAVEAFVVVVQQYTAHPENIFKASVAQRTVDGYNCFLLTDEDAVIHAVADGAVRLADSGLQNPF